MPLSEMGLGCVLTCFLSLWISGSQLWSPNLKLVPMKRVFTAASRFHSGRMVAKDVIIALIAGIGELIGMTSFKSSGPTCSQITKQTKS